MRRATRNHSLTRVLDYGYPCDRRGLELAWLELGWVLCAPRCAPNSFPGVLHPSSFTSPELCTFTRAFRLLAHLLLIASMLSGVSAQIRQHTRVGDHKYMLGLDVGPFLHCLGSRGVLVHDEAVEGTIAPLGHQDIGDGRRTKNGVTWPRGRGRAPWRASSWTWTWTWPTWTWTR